MVGESCGIDAAKQVFEFWQVLGEAQRTSHLIYNAFSRHLKKISAFHSSMYTTAPVPPFWFHSVSWENFHDNIQITEKQSRHQSWEIAKALKLHDGQVLEDQHSSQHHNYHLNA